MRSSITVPTGQVVGIGKLKVFASDDFPYVIPTLSFVVAKTEAGECTASCMQLLIEGTAENEQEAVERMNENCKLFLRSLFNRLEKTDAWEELHELANSELTKDYWKAYRDVQLDLAEQGKELKFEREKFYENKIQELEKQIERLKSLKQDFQVEVVSYQSYGNVA